MRMLAGLAETAAFLDLGMTCMLFGVDDYRPALIGWAILLCCVTRPLQIYFFSFVLNQVCTKPRVSRFSVWRSADLSAV